MYLLARVSHFVIVFFLFSGACIILFFLFLIVTIIAVSYLEILISNITFMCRARR